MTATTIRTTLLATGLLGAALLTGCDDPRPDPAPTGSPASAEPPVISVPTAAATGTSILRPEVASEPVADAKPEALTLVIAFPEGARLTPEAEQKLTEVIGSEVLASGWPIVLRGHSDSDGSAAANLATSRRRAQVVADWLADHGVEEDRIEVVALGAQNPAAPNANADGSPNEAGRARNRRVEITIAPPPGEATPPAPEPEQEGRGPTVAERLSRD